MEPLVASGSPDFDVSGSDIPYRSHGADYSAGDRHSRVGGDGSRGGTMHRIDRTPVSMPRVCSKSSFLCGRRNEKEDDDIVRSFEKSSFLPDCGFGFRRSSKAAHPADVPDGDEETDEHGYVVERKGNSRNHESPDGGDGAAAAAGGRGAGGLGARARGKKGGVGSSDTAVSPGEKNTVTNRLVRALEKQLKRLADPDMQLAGLI